MIGAASYRVGLLGDARNTGCMIATRYPEPISPEAGCMTARLTIY